MKVDWCVDGFHELPANGLVRGPTEAEAFSYPGRKKESDWGLFPDTPVAGASTG